MRSQSGPKSDCWVEWREFWDALICAACVWRRGGYSSTVVAASPSIQTQRKVETSSRRRTSKASQGRKQPFCWHWWSPDPRWSFYHGRIKVTLLPFRNTKHLHVVLPALHLPLHPEAVGLFMIETKITINGNWRGLLVPVCWRKNSGRKRTRRGRSQVPISLKCSFFGCVAVKFIYAEIHLYSGRKWFPLTQMITAPSFVRFYLWGNVTEALNTL